MLQGLERLEHFYFLEKHWYNNVSFFVNIFISFCVYDLNSSHPKIGRALNQNLNLNLDIYDDVAGDPNDQYNLSPFH